MYDFMDMRQAALGSVVAVLFFYLLRAGNPISIDPTLGLVIGGIWLWITTQPYITDNLDTKVHAMSNIAVALVISSGLAYVFGMVTVEQLQSFEFFGTAAWLGTLLALPAATFFDKQNIINPYDKWYISKRRK